MLDTAQAMEGGGDAPVFHPVNKVQCIAFADNKERKRNMKYAFSLNLPRLQSLVRTQSESLAIVAGGPSLNKTYKKISRFRNIMSCGSSHDHVIKLGIKPTYHIDCDPHVTHANNFREEGPPGLNYLIASRCHRSLFKRLKDKRVYMWHMWEEELGKKMYRGEPAFICGASVILAALPMALSMGFKNINFFGFDCSFEKDEEHHAYPQKEDAQIMTARVGDPVNGRDFRTTATWIGVAQQFEDMQNHWGHLFKTTIHGDNMIADMQKIREVQIANQTAKKGLAA